MPLSYTVLIYSFLGGLCTLYFAGKGKIGQELWSVRRKTVQVTSQHVSGAVL